MKATNVGAETPSSLSPPLLSGSVVVVPTQQEQLTVPRPVISQVPSLAMDDDSSSDDEEDDDDSVTDEEDDDEEEEDEDDKYSIQPKPLSLKEQFEEDHPSGDPSIQRIDNDLPSPTASSTNGMDKYEVDLAPPDHGKGTGLLEFHATTTPPGVAAIATTTEGQGTDDKLKLSQGIDDAAFTGIAKGESASPLSIVGDET